MGIHCSTLNILTHHLCRFSVLPTVHRRSCLSLFQRLKGRIENYEALETVDAICKLQHHFSPRTYCTNKVWPILGPVCESAHIVDELSFTHFLHFRLLL